MSENRFQNYEENQAGYLVEIMGRLADQLNYLDPFYKDVAKWTLDHLEILNQMEESLRDDRLCEKLMQTLAEQEQAELFAVFMFLHKKRYQ